MEPSPHLEAVRGSIVVAVDGSEHADRALGWAAQQASREHRRLTVLSVGDHAAGLVDDAVSTARLTYPDLEVVGCTASGDARQVLIDASADAHLLVVGSRGRGTVRSMLLGSVSATLSTHSVCPVVVCRPAVEGDTRAGVVVGADGTPESRPVLDLAFRMAALHGLPLTVLHSFFDAAAAVAQYDEARGRRTDDPDLEGLRMTLSASVAGFAETYPDVPVTLTLTHGFADTALAPSHGGWALVVVGRHPVTSLVRLLTGSLAGAVVERAHATVAVVPQDPASR